MSGRTIRAVGIVALILVVALPLSSCGGNGPTGETVREGVTTTSTAPPSVPARPTGITADQIKELLARTAGSMRPEEWTVRDYKNLGDWAAARVYSDAFTNQDGKIGRGVVFKKTNGAWFLKGWVEPYDLPRAKIALDDMDASEDVRAYFAGVASAAPEDVFVVELHKQAVLFSQTLDLCRGLDSLQNIGDISEQLRSIHAKLSEIKAPTERTNQVAGQLLRLVERLENGAAKAQAGFLSQAEFDREVVLVTDHLPLATDDIARLQAGLGVTTTTTRY